MARRGAVLAYHPAVATRRFMWISEEVRTRDPLAALIVTEAIGLRGSKWRPLPSELEFLRRTVPAGGGRRYETVALVSDETKQQDQLFWGGREGKGALGFVGWDPSSP